ncbi:MAG: DUF3179 domain-containing protein [Bryobacterales bacterium]|nr:DUF3179 domain-containing protein [Bryobacterales bacterium]
MNPFAIPCLALLLAAPAGAQFAAGEWKTDTSRKSIDLRELLRGGPPKDGIPSIDRPRFIPAGEASWLSPKEMVIAFELAGAARAYPLQILMWHELVNDSLGATPVLVSYCPLCNSAIVFDRRVDGNTLEFGVSGMLRNSDMVMYDRQTDSLWQQITGEGIVGEYTGKILRILPSQMIAFDEFKTAWPKGVVLSRETGFSREYGRNPYRGYEFGSGPIMPVPEARKTSLRPMEKLVVLKHGNGYRAYPVSRLARSRVVEDRIDGRFVVVFYSPEGLSALDAQAMEKSRAAGSVGVFVAEADGRRMRFRRNGDRIEDKETGSEWSVTGMAREGALQGARLAPVEHGVYFAFAWLAFEPRTVIVGEAP